MVSNNNIYRMHVCARIILFTVVFLFAGSAGAITLNVDDGSNVITIPAGIGSFSDDFGGSTLDSGWIMINKNSDSNIFLTGTGILRMNASPKNGGSDYYYRSNYNALRILQPVNGDGIVETKMIFSPTNNYQGAGIMMCYEDNPDSDVCDRVAERAFYPNVGGSVLRSAGTYVDYTNSTTYFRLIKKGMEYTGWYSSDGVDWVLNGQGTLSKPIKYVGLFAVRQPWDGDTNVYSVVDFDYFNITPLALSPAPTLTPKKISTAGSASTLRDGGNYVDSDYTTTPPLIDGLINQNEWGKPAIIKTLCYENAVTSQQENHEMFTYFMNDNNYLYITIKITNDDFESEHVKKGKDVDAITLFFDNNNNGITEINEDIKSFWNLEEYRDMFWKVADKKYSKDESLDGEGVATHSNYGIGNYTYELKIPLNSGDIYDLAITPNSTVGIRILYDEMDWDSTTDTWTTWNFKRGNVWPAKPEEYGKLKLSSFTSSNSKNVSYEINDCTKIPKAPSKSAGSNVYFFDREGNILWSYRVGDTIGTISASSDGSYVATSGDGNVYFLNKEGEVLWTYKMGKSFWDISSKGSPFIGVTVSSDGSHVTAWSENNAYFFDKEGNLLWNNKVAGSIKSVSISSDGSYIAVGSENKNDQKEDIPKVYFFNKEGKLLWSYKTVTGTSWKSNWDVYDVSVSSDGSYIAVGSWGVYFLSKEGKLLWRSDTGWINKVFISSDSSYITAESQEKKVFLFNNEGIPLWRNSMEDFFKVSAASDGSNIVIGTSGHHTTDKWVEDGSIYFYNRKGELLWNYKICRSINSISVSADGSHIAVGCYDNKIYFLNHDGDLLWNYAAGNIIGLSASSDGSYIIAGVGNLAPKPSLAQTNTLPIISTINTHTITTVLTIFLLALLGFTSMYFARIIYFKITNTIAKKCSSCCRLVRKNPYCAYCGTKL